MDRWENDIKTDIQEMGCGFEMDLSDSEQGDVAGPYKRGN
jgi:hypothetical protein